MATADELNALVSKLPPPSADSVTDSAAAEPSASDRMLGALYKIDHPNDPSVTGLKPGQVTGWSNVLGATVRRSGSALLDSMIDPVHAVSVPVNTAVQFAHDLLAPMLGYPRFTPTEREHFINNPDVSIFPHLSTPWKPGEPLPEPHLWGTPYPEGKAPAGPVTEISNAAADLSQKVLPPSLAWQRPEDVVPTTPAQETTSAILGGAISGAPFGAIAAGVNAAGSYIGNRLGKVVPDWAKPAVEQGANLGVNVLAYKGGYATRSGARKLGEKIDDLRGPLGGGAPKPVVDPDTGAVIPKATTQAPVPGMSPAPAGPLTATPRAMARVGQTLAEKANTTPEQMAAKLKVASPSPVPGYQPTTAEISGDATGDNSLFQALRTNGMTSTAAQAAINARRTGNTLALINNLKDAAPADVGRAAGDYLAAHLARTKAEIESGTVAATAAATTAREGAGLESAAITGPNAAQTIGEAQRAAIIPYAEAAREERSNIWNVLPPDLATDMTSLGTAARNLLVNEPGRGGHFYPGEEAILNGAAQYNGIVPFSDVEKFQRNLSALKRTIKDKEGTLSNPAGHRLGVIEDAMNAALSESAAKGAEADVASGVPPGERLSDKIVAAAPPRQPIRLPNGAVFDPDRVGGPGIAPAQAAASTTPLQNMSEHWLQVKAERNKQYAISLDKWQRGVMGDVLAQSGGYLHYNIPSSGVGDWLWRKGPKGAETADQLVNALGTREAALEVLGDYPALTLRNQAMRTGVLDVPQFEKWKTDYKAMLDKFPEIRARFQTAADAQQTVIDAVRHGQDVIKQFETSAASHYLTKAGEPADVHKAIDSLMTSKNPAIAARDLMVRVSGDDAATAGVQRNAIDWVLKRASLGVELVPSLQQDFGSGKLNNLLGTPRSPTPARRALEQILTKPQMQILNDTQNQLMKSSRQWNAIKVEGSPGTARDLYNILTQKAGAFLGKYGTMTGISAFVVGSLLSHWITSLGGVAAAGEAIWGAGKLKTLYAAGMRNEQDLLTEAILNPAFGRVVSEAAAAKSNARKVEPPARRMYAAWLAAMLNAPNQGYLRTHPMPRGMQ